MKRKISILLAFFLMLVGNDASAVERNYLRRSYSQAPTNKALCQSLIADLKNHRRDYVDLAYLGGLQTIWANHVFNPLSKLQTFKEGRSKVEKAVQEAPDNFEVRLVRLSIQKNAPRFLGYYQHIDQDEQFLRSRLSAVESPLLVQIAGSLLAQPES